MQYKDRHEVILAGSGGQGLVLAGIILAEAAILDGKNAVQTQSYGIASRGGFSMAEVICDKAEIIYPHVEIPDMILAMTQEALLKYRQYLEKGARLLFDSTLVEAKTEEGCIGLPLTKMADVLGNVGAANIIALGAIAAATGVATPESLAAIITNRFSPRACEVNLKALSLGAASLANHKE